jgi:SNF2 family DNA or RNA helicase
MRLLKPMMRKRQKVVVFSQFVSMLELIECELRQHGWRCMKLTGSTRRRSAVVEQFQSESGPLVFLISLQAGGAGLNLTAAEHVVLYDPWWNPAVERQAGDRAHRIGQKKAVTIWKMLARNTIEEKVLSLQSYKKALADGTLDPSASLRSLEDVQNLINGSEEPPPWNKKDSSLWKPDNSSSDAEDSEENDDDDSDDDSGEEWKREP